MNNYFALFVPLYRHQFFNSASVSCVRRFKCFLEINQLFVYLLQNCCRNKKPINPDPETHRRYQSVQNFRRLSVVCRSISPPLTVLSLLCHL